MPRNESDCAIVSTEIIEMAALQTKMWSQIIILVILIVGIINGSKELQDFYGQINQLIKDIATHDELLPMHPVEVPGWPRPIPNLGQVTGVAINPLHQPVIFHRGPRIWDESSFNDSHHFQYINQGPITVDTLIILDPDTGEMITSWGNDMFYMPHGLTIDRFGYYYVTDTALHQVFKLRPGLQTPLLEFGRRFEPGSGIFHLCKPTDVAVASTGEIFIADGYCNSRVLKFDADGNVLSVIPQNQQFISLRTPHSLTLLEDLDLLCIADRDNMRVVCPRAGLEGPTNYPYPVLTVQQPDLGLVYAVASLNGQVYAVNGPTVPTIPVRGFTIDPIREKVLDQWTSQKGFQNPHDIDVCSNTSSLYVAETGPNRVWKFQLKKMTI